jgi:hypothetical protein
MTPRSLFSIIIKVIGIYLIVESLFFIPSFIVAIFQQSRTMDGGSKTEIWEGNFFMLLVAAGYLLVIRFCLFKTDWLIDKLYLDRGFREEKFELNIHRSTVLNIAVILFGAITIIDALPLFCKQVFAYSHFAGPNKGFKENPASGWIVYYVVKLFAGYFLVTASRLVVNIIERKTRARVSAQAKLD